MAEKKMTRSRRRAQKIKYPKSFDYTLLFLLVFIIGFGLVMICSTSSYSAMIKYGDALYYFKRQLAFTFIGTGAMMLFYFLGYYWVNRLGRLVYGIGVLMMLLLPFLGTESHGAKRWIYIGSVSIQPAEILKFGVICYGAWKIASAGGVLKGRKNIFKFMMSDAAVPALIVYMLSKNLSSGIIVFLIGMFLCFLATPQIKKWFLAIVSLVGASGLLVFGIAHLPTGNGGSFRVQRIITWLHPESDLTGTGYQTIQALYAIGSGGFFGKGLGKSLQKLGYVPESQNDMIFSIICEELGIFGAVCVIVVFAALLYHIWDVAYNAKDSLGFYLCMGVFAQVAIQVILNIAVVTNLIPNTGVSLPFISYGGSSAALLMAEFGLVLAVSRKTYEAAAKEEGQQP